MKDRASSPRWLLGILIGLLIALLAGGAWFYTFQRQRVRSEVEANLQAVAALKVDQIVAWRAERLGDAAVLMEDPYLVEAVPRWLADPQPGDAEQILARFRSREHYHYSDVLLVDADGQVLLSLHSSGGELHADAGEALAEAFHSRQPVIADLHFMQGEETPHIDVIAPFFAGTGPEAEPVGAVLLRYYAGEFLYPLIQSWPLPDQTAETLLIRQEGDDVLFLNELRHRQDTALTLRIPLAETDVVAVMAVQGLQGVVWGRDYRGVEVLAVITPVPDTPWYMVSKIDVAEAFAAWRFESALILALVLTLLAGTMAAAGVAWQSRQSAHYRTLWIAEAALRESEERYHVTLMSVGEGVITTDPEGKVNLLNAVAEQLTGWSQAEAVGRPLEEVFHIVNELTREGVESPVRRVVREGVVVGLANSTILIARDGVERPIADSGAPVHDENGKLLGVVLVFRDQTEERRQQEMLRESEERYRSTLENMLEGCQIIGYDWRYLYVNEAAARHGRKTRDELLGRTMMEAYPGIEETAMFSMLRRCMQEREPAYLENRFAFPDGSARWFELNMQPVPEGVFILSIDITERKEAEEALRESEERYRSLFTQVPAGLYRTALDGRVIDVNPALVGILGYPDRETLLAVRSPDLYASPERRRELLARLERDGVVRGFETDLLRYDGEKIWVVADASLSRDSTGQPVMEGSITDITERRRAEERVRRLLAQQTTINALALALGDSRGLDEVYSTIYEHVCALMDAPFFAVASYDSEGQAIRPNCVIAEGRVLDTSGFPPASLEEEGRAMQSRVMRTGEPVYLPELPDALKAIWRSDSDGVDCSLPEGTPPEDGEKPGRSGLFVPMKVGGQIVGLMHVQSCRPDAYSPEDISLLDGLANVAAVAIQNARLYAELETYSRGLEQAVEERTAELQAANEALKELDRMKDAFLSTAAHELRTPLTSIRAFSELLLIREFDDEREARYLTMIKTQSQRLADIINDLLDISRLESSQELVFDFRPVDMGALIAETVQPFIDTASEHHFRVEGDKPLPLIQGDTFRLGQVLTNLISNAVKYSSGGSVVIASRVMDTSLEVSVQDEGMGLTPERQAHLFEKFYRAPEVAHIAGSGLGLAICKLIIEKHGGQIWAESESGKGSTFTFTVPLHGDRPSSVR